MSDKQDLVDQVCDWGNTMGQFVYQRNTDGAWCTYCPVCKIQLGLGSQSGCMGDIRYQHLLEHSESELKRHIVKHLMGGA